MMVLVGSTLLPLHLDGKRTQPHPCHGYQGRCHPFTLLKRTHAYTRITHAMHISKQSYHDTNTLHFFRWLFSRPNPSPLCGGNPEEGSIFLPPETRLEVGRCPNEPVGKRCALGDFFFSFGLEESTVVLSRLGARLVPIYPLPPLACALDLVDALLLFFAPPHPSPIFQLHPFSSISGFGIKPFPGLDNLISLQFFFCPRSTVILRIAIIIALSFLPLVFLPSPSHVRVFFIHLIPIG